MIVQNSREEKNRSLIVLIVRLNMFISFITKPFFMTMIMEVLHCHWKKYYYPTWLFFDPNAIKVFAAGLCKRFELMLEHRYCLNNNDVANIKEIS